MTTSNILWNSALRSIENQIGSDYFRLWIRPLTCQESEISATQNTIQLFTDNEFVIEIIQNRFMSTIQQAIQQVAGFPCIIKMTAKAAEAAPNSSHATANSGGGQTPPETPSLQTTQPTQNYSKNLSYSSNKDLPSLDPSINPLFTFSSFVVGTSNQFANASAMAVAEKPGTQYNPLFIHAAPGLGKTHLLHAIANHIRMRTPSARIGLVSAENFANELIQSIRHESPQKFRDKYRSFYDVLLIDDIWFIAGKPSTEEEFFHTFNDLINSKRQIVLTSDRPPREIEKLQERIRTRFESGLVADISTPEIETRIAILKARAERDDIYLPDDVALFIANHIKTNVRELEGILVKLQMDTSISGAEISLDMAKTVLREQVPEEPTQATVDSIQQAVARHFGLRLGDLKSLSRQSKVAQPRQIAMYLIRRYTPLDLMEIGALFGGREHSTVIHGIKSVEKKVERDPKFRENVEAIQRFL